MLGPKTEEDRCSTVGRAQNNLRKDSGSGKARSGHFFPLEEDGGFCWLRTGPLFVPHIGLRYNNLNIY